VDVLIHAKVLLGCLEQVVLVTKSTAILHTHVRCCCLLLRGIYILLGLFLQRFPGRLHGFQGLCPLLYEGLHFGRGEISNTLGLSFPQLTRLAVQPLADDFLKEANV